MTIIRVNTQNYDVINRANTITINNNLVKILDAINISKQLKFI